MKNNNIVEYCLIIIAACMVVDVSNTLYWQNKAISMGNQMIEGNFNSDDHFDSLNKWKEKENVVVILNGLG